MWDEKKFFEDFVKESEQIQPDAEFLKKMESLVSEEVSKETENAGFKERKQGKIVSIRKRAGMLAGVAAALILCVVGAGLIKGNEKSDGKLSSPGLYAEKTETDEPGKFHFSAQDADSDESDKANEKEMKKLELLKEMLKAEDTLVTDEAGTEIAKQEREALVKKLETAEKADALPEEREDSYTWVIKGEIQIKAEIINQNFLCIDGDKKLIYEFLQND